MHILAELDKISLFEGLYSFDRAADFDSVGAKKLMKENERLARYMDKIFNHVPATLHMAFDDLKDHHFRYVTSDDGKVRVYSWETFVNEMDNQFFQYKAGDSVRVSWINRISGDVYEPGFYASNDYTSITGIATKDGKTVYLVIYDTYIPRTHDISSSVDAYTIEKNKLVATPFFRTTKKTLSSISYNFDGQANPPNVDNHIHVSADKQKLYIPIVNVASVTDKYLIYKFDGSQFVFERDEK